MVKGKLEMLKSLEKGNYKEAMKIAKKLKKEFNKDEISAITRGYESYTNPRFYISLRQNIQENIEIAIKLLLSKYKGELTNG